MKSPISPSINVSTPDSISDVPADALMTEQRSLRQIFSQILESCIFDDEIVLDVDDAHLNLQTNFGRIRVHGSRVPQGDTIKVFLDREVDAIAWVVADELRIRERMSLNDSSEAIQSAVQSVLDQIIGVAQA